MHFGLVNSIVHDSFLGSFLALIVFITDVSWVISNSGMYNNQKIHQVSKPNYALLMVFNTNIPIHTYISTIKIRTTLVNTVMLAN